LMRLEPAAVGPLSIVVVTFHYSAPSPDAFHWLDEASGPPGPDPAALLGSARDHGEGFGASLFNHLAGPVIARHPEIGEAKGTLLEGGASGALMTGSGPTVFGVLGGPDVRLDPGAEREIEALAGSPPAYVTAKGSTV